MPGGILLDGQGAGGYGLGGIPCDEPETGVVGALAVATGYLQIAPVEEAVAGGDNAVFRHHLGGAAAHVVVSTGHAHAIVVLCEKDGAIFGVIGDIPDTRAGLDAGLVAVVIVGGREDIVRLVLDGGVLVEGVGRVGVARGALLLDEAVSDVIVVPSVESGAVHHVADEFAPVVVGEHIVAGGTLPCERAGSRAAQGVVPVGVSWRNRSCGDADHALVYTLLSTQKAKCTTKSAFFSKKIAAGLQGA